MFFSCSKLALQITNGFVYAALVILISMGLRAVYQRFVKNLGNERVTQIVDKRKILKNRRFANSNYFMLAVCIALIQFSKIVFAV